KLKVMSLRICRFGGTVFPTRFMVKTYWAIVVLDVLAERDSFVKPRSLSQGGGERRFRGVFPRQMHRDGVKSSHVRSVQKPDPVQALQPGLCAGQGDVKRHLFAPGRRAT